MAVLLTLLFTVAGILFFVIPVFFTSLTYLLHQPYKSVYGFIKVALTGGMFSVLWLPVAHLASKSYSAILLTATNYSIFMRCSIIYRYRGDSASQ